MRLRSAPAETEHAPSEPAIPTFPEHATEWNARTIKLRELDARREDILYRLEELHVQHDEQTLNATKVQDPPRKPSPRIEKARALLGGLLPTGAGSGSQEHQIASTPQILPANAVAAEAKALSEEYEVSTAAAEMLRGEMASVCAKASREYCLLIAPRYSPVVSRLTDALTELGNAYAAHADFVSALVASGCNPAFLMMPDLDAIHSGLGDPREGHSGFRRFLAREAELGRRESGAVPEPWRPRPKQETPRLPERPRPTRRITIIHRSKLRPDPALDPSQV